MVVECKIQVRYLQNNRLFIENKHLQKHRNLQNNRSYQSDRY